MSDFIHLRLNTEYSLSKSIITINGAIKKAAEDNRGALALTDLNNLFGAIKFYEAAQKNGVKPIIGTEISVYEDAELKENNKKYSMILIAKNIDGYKNIIKLISKSYTENRRKDGAGIKKEWLDDPAIRQNVILLSGGKYGDIGQSLLNDEIQDAEDRAIHWKTLFGDDFYIELQRDGSAEETSYMEGAVTLANKLQIPPVATHPSLFLTADDYLAHEAKVCIAAGDTIYNQKRVKEYNKENYFKTSAEMEELFSDLPEAIKNTIEIAKKCNTLMKLNNPQLPIFATPNNIPVDDYFEQLAKEGLEFRLKELYPNETVLNSKRASYDKRIETEINTIKQMGFPSYFLIVSDFIKWAKDNDIPVGPGRGSGAGSLVAYSLLITGLDPLAYDLLFERFLNPERVSMPDFDVDFCQERREEVIKYVTEKYGQKAVSQIGTFGTMGAKSVIRDVGRVLDYPYPVVDSIAKMLPPVMEVDLEEYVETDEKMIERINNEPEVKKLMDIALKISGLTRQVGTHPAGVLISPTTIEDFTPLYQGEDSNIIASQFDKKDIEKAGLVKFDFLGLRNLTIINNAVIQINKKPEFKDKPFNIEKILLNDDAVYKVFIDGNTTAIFQSESKGAKDLETKLKPDTFEDIIALMALNRPGPIGSGMVDNYIKRKHGLQDIDYLHPNLKEILEPTYGIIVYQEQVMQIAQVLSGFSLGEADLLRRAMGYKKPEEMAKQKDGFIAGAVKNGVEAENADMIFTLIEKFAEYGFNKSHSAAYALLAYQTAYLKHNYTEEFMAATLDSELGATDKISILISDCKLNNLEVLPPDINKSEYKFKIEDKGQLRYGLGAIKGIGKPASLAIEKIRAEHGDYTSFYDFLEKVGKGAVNKKTIDGLIKSGAFDSIENNRASLLASLEDSLDYTNEFTKRKLKEEGPLDELIGKRRKKATLEDLERPPLKDVEQWDDIQKLSHERAALGFFFSSNPYDVYAAQMGGLKAATPVNDLESLFTEQNTKNAFIAGIIQEITHFKSKKGAFVKIGDSTGIRDVVVFSDALEENKNWLKQDQFAAFAVKIQQDRSGVGISLTAQSIYDMDKTKQLNINKLYAGLNTNSPTESEIKEFNDICSKYSDDDSNTECLLMTMQPETDRLVVKSSIQKINYCKELEGELISKYGHNLVKSTYVDKLNVFALSNSKSGKTYKSNYTNKKALSV